MTYTVVFEKINEADFPRGYHYAHIPSLDLTTHGLGIEGARESAKDLIKGWLEEKRASHEEIKIEDNVVVSQIEFL